MRLDLSTQLANRLVLGTFEFRRLSEAKAAAILDRYFEMGGVWVDTAGFYGHGEVEARLGRYFRTRRPKRRLATKLGHFNRAEAYRCAPTVEEVYARAVERLDSLPDLVLLHEADWAVWWSPGQTVGRVLDEHTAIGPRAPAWAVLREIKSLLSCQIGVTGNNAMALSRVVPALSPDAVLVAKQFDLLWRTAVCLAHVAEDCGAKIWLGAPFHQGWLMRLSEVASGNDERGAAARRLAASLQARRILPQDIAVRFVLEAWPEALVVFGVASVKELMSAIRSAATPLSDGLLAELMTSGFAGDPMAGPEPIRR